MSDDWFRDKWSKEEQQAIAEHLKNGKHAKPAVRVNTEDTEEHSSTQEYPENSDIPRGEEQRGSVLSVSSESSALSVSNCVLCVNPGEEDAIRQSVPTARVNVKSALFGLARRLKAIHRLTDAGPKNVEPHLISWYDLSRAFLEKRTLEDVAAEFFCAWKKIRYPAGTGPLAETLLKAKASIPKNLPVCCQDGHVALMAAVCRQLQHGADKMPFFLGCRAAGELVGISHVAANKWLRLLENMEVLKETEKGTLKTGKATEWRYLLPLE